MRNHPKAAKPDSKVDAWAIFFIIMLVVGTAVFWVQSPISQVNANLAV